MASIISMRKRSGTYIHPVASGEKPVKNGWVNARQFIDARKREKHLTHQLDLLRLMTAK